MGTDAQTRFDKAEDKRKKQERKAKHKAKVKAAKAAANRGSDREVDRLEAAMRASEEVAVLMRENVAKAMANVDDMEDMDLKSRKVVLFGFEVCFSHPEE